MIRAIPRVALQLWIVLFIVFFGAEVVHLEPGLRVIAQLAYGVPLAAWAALRLRGPVDRLEWAILGLLVLYAVICLFSRDRTESVETMGLASAYAAWFMLMRRAASSSLRRPVVVAVATGLAVTLVINAYLLIDEKLQSYAAIGAARFEGVATFPWESVNALPILVLVAVPFISMVALRSVRIAMALAVGFSAVVVVPISQGRAGWAGLAAAGIVLLILLPATWRTVRRIPRRRRALAGAALGVAVILGLAVTGPRLLTAVGESGRLIIWEQALAMFRGSPWIGGGPSVYSWARLEFPPAGADLLEVRLLHDAALQTLVEGGLILFAGVAVVLVVWGMTSAPRRGDWTMPDRLTAASIAGFLVALTLDDFSYLPAIIAAYLTLAAFLCPASQAKPPRGWIAAAVLALAALAALPSVVAVDVARTAAQQGRSLMANGEYAAAITRFEIAAAAHPESGGYWLGLGMAAAYAGDEQRAIDAYVRATVAAPGDPRGYAALAQIGPGAERVDRLRAAADRSLDDPQDGARLGVALAAAGDTAGTTAAWGRAVALRSEVLRLLPFDGTGVAMEAVAAEARRLIRDEPRPAPHENQATLWDIALILDELPDDADPAWRAVDAARKGDLDAARELAASAVMAAPYEARGHQATAAVAAFACDPEAEQRALALEREANGAYVEPQSGPHAVREFIYREASLGHSQPPGARLDLRVERWPWSLVDRPDACGP